VAKPEWGVKRICHSCGVKFYDLCRSPITCPSCGTLFETESPARSRRSKPAVAKEIVAATAKDAEPEDDDLADDDLVEIEDDDDDLIEDTSDLGGDDEITPVKSDDEAKDS
jgi:uncharacterized protein (TIGR02300 family)